jgi:alpha-tubulin suppressor-like RCC1 family protein
MRTFHVALLLAVCFSLACGDATGPEAVPTSWAQVVAGRAHACGLTDHGVVFCWGDTTSGQAGQPWGPVTSPRSVQADVTFTGIAAGGDTTCGVSGQGSLFCWGNNALGQAGDGTRLNSYQPVAVAGGLEWSTVSVGTYHVCGIDTQRRLHCWGGDRWSVALGYPPFNDCTAPRFEPTWPCSDTPIPDFSDGTYDWIEAGLYQTCAGTNGGNAVCWGTNDHGQLGATADRECMSNDPLHIPSVACSPAPLAPEGASLSRIHPGTTHGCGLDTQGLILCWGGLRLNFGQIGNGSFDGSPTPVPVGAGGPYTAVYASHESDVRTFSCGIEQGGGARCWGGNRQGQLGSGQSPPCGPGGLPCRDVPTAVGGNHSFQALALGAEFACGLNTDREILCWGTNAGGQLGDGTQTSRSEPRRIGS